MRYCILIVAAGLLLGCGGSPVVPVSATIPAGQGIAKAQACNELISAKIEAEPKSPVEQIKPIATVQKSALSEAASAVAAAVGEAAKRDAANAKLASEVDEWEHAWFGGKFWRVLKWLIAIWALLGIAGALLTGLLASHGGFLFGVGKWLLGAIPDPLRIFHFLSATVQTNQAVSAAPVVNVNVATPTKE